MKSLSTLSIMIIVSINVTLNKSQIFTKTSSEIFGMRAILWKSQHQSTQQSFTSPQFRWWLWFAVRFDGESCEEKKSGAYLNGCNTARCRSIATAVNVNTDTFTLTVWTNGQKAHMKSGRSHRWSKAAWNCGIKMEAKIEQEFISNKRFSKLGGCNESDFKVVKMASAHIYLSFICRIDIWFSLFCVGCGM